MTLQIEVAPEMESRLHEAAARRGLSEGEYVRHLLEELLAAQDESEDARLAAIDAAMGALAHTATSSAGFCRRKQQEIELEEQQFRQRRLRICPIQFIR